MERRAIVRDIDDQTLVATATRTRAHTSMGGSQRPSLKRLESKVGSHSALAAVKPLLGSSAGTPSLVQLQASFTLTPRRSSSQAARRRVTTSRSRAWRASTGVARVQHAAGCCARARHFAPAGRRSATSSRRRRSTSASSTAAARWSRRASR